MAIRNLPDNERNMSEVPLIYKPRRIVHEEGTIDDWMESIIMASAVKLLIEETNNKEMTEAHTSSTRWSYPEREPKH